MLRAITAFFCMLVLCIVVAQAEEITCKIAKVDADKNTLTITVDGKDQTLPVDKDATFLIPGKKKQLQPFAGGLSAIQVGTGATVTTEKKDSKDVVTKVVLEKKKKKGA